MFVWNEVICLGDSITYGARDKYGRSYPVELSKLLTEELEQIKLKVGGEKYKNGKFKEESDIFYSMSTSAVFDEFLTLLAYKLI